MTRECHIYFIEAGKGGPIKIGRANYIATRLRDMQVGNHLPLAVLASFEGIPDNEGALHSLFRESNIRGEWFERTEALISAIEYLDRIDAKRAHKYIARKLRAKDAAFQEADRLKRKKIKGQKREQGLLGRGWTAHANL